jgi:hypothetical protein
MTTNLEDGTTQSDAHKVEVVATKLLQSQQTLLPASSEQQVRHDSNFPTSQRCVKEQGTGFMHQQRSATSGTWSIDYLAKIPQSEGDTVIPNNGDYFTCAHIKPVSESSSQPHLLQKKKKKVGASKHSIGF